MAGSIFLHSKINLKKVKKSKKSIEISRAFYVEIRVYFICTSDIENIFIYSNFKVIPI